jgi:hypothetical protein
MFWPQPRGTKEPNGLHPKEVGYAIVVVDAAATAGGDCANPLVGLGTAEWILSSPSS